MKNGVVVNTTLTPNTLDCAQYVPFWVSWASGVITAGLGQPGSQQLVSYTDGQPVEVNGIGLSSNMSDNNNGAFWDLKQDQGIVIRCQPSPALNYSGIHTPCPCFYIPLRRMGIYRISGSAWCFLAVGTAFWLYLPRLFTNNSENCETPFPCQTLSSCLRATRAILCRLLKASFS